MSLEKYNHNMGRGWHRSFPRINLHLFRAILEEVIEGKISEQMFFGVVEENLGIPLTELDIVDLQKLLTSINDCVDRIEKFLLVDEMYQ